MKRAALAAAIVLVSGVVPASAQLMLPGAIHTQPPEAASKAPQAGTDSSGAGAPPSKPAPTRMQPPAEATIIGRELSRDGSEGLMAFTGDQPKGLRISSLSLVGEELASPGSPCLVDVVAAAPIEARFTDRLGGLSRYEVELAACPFSFEVLDGAVRVTREPRTCVLEAAGCRVDPTGLWGPKGNSIDAKQIKQWEQARARAEASMRAGFRALLATAGKDREAIKRIAGEQAGFSSERAMACGTYAGEDQHGFCALRLTEARVLALQARHEAATKEKPPARGAMRKKAEP